MSQTLVATANQLPSLTDSLDAYIRSVNSIPVLSVSEEKALAVRLRNQNELEAARNLVLAHLRFVVHIARGYSGYGLPLGDLIQEGNVGLMKAVKRFDPDQNVRLVSFAVHWIRAEIHEFVLRNWRIVKIATTKSQRKLFFNLRSSKKRLGWLSRREVEAVASDLGVKPETVVEMEARLAGQDMAFDPSPGRENQDDGVLAPAAYLSDDTSLDPAEAVEDDDWNQSTQIRLQGALESLDQRSRDIVSRRWLTENKATLQDLAQHYGVSAERIRQIENNALKKIRVGMEV